MNEERIICDKNFIQGTNYEDLKKFTHLPYRPLVTRGLLVECLANLNNKESKNSSTPEQMVASLFKKIDLFPICELDWQDLIKKELIDDATISIRNNLFNYNLMQENVNTVDIFDHLGSKEQIERWSKEDFSDDDKEIVSDYSKAKEDKLKELQDFHAPKLDTTSIINSTKVKTIELPLEINNILIGYIEYFLARFFINNINIEQSREKIIKKMKTAPLSEFAPYFSFVLTLRFLFYRYFLQKYRPDNKTKLVRDFIDFDYMTYLPFVDCFATEDKMLIEFIKEFFPTINIVRKDK